MTATPPARPGLRDVARLAGVSHQTVSRVFKDHPMVSPKTRDRVLAAAAQLDFRPNAAARALATGRSSTLGVVSFDTALHGPASIIAAIERHAREAGFFTSVAGLGSAGRGTVAGAVERFRDQGVDGLIMIPGHVPPEEAVRHLPGDLPMVMLGPPAAVPTVQADHYHAPGEAARYLLGLGHRTVHHLPGPADWSEATERTRGWRDALAAAGAEIPGCTPGDWSARSGYERGRVLAADPDVTAVFAANDQIALGLLWAIHESGRRVPEDVSVIGFDDIPEAAFLTPPLSTVRQDFAALGRHCVELLVAQLTDPGAAPGPAAVVPSELVIRRSTGPAR
ncbi:LacI family DNA-binding transcriptional regulator [Actinomadura sp. WMMB 499]|uniref:LacI family DNA-binding transcriptional regulator n=1 Tax=Actinomadura sp. WMMB 499 TaxID=1219491 RepID=UPI001244AA9D|nr:LacI family DNA-binding transcriptional regulator [Actinomadura sp. WMMB 499]QFG20599.1 LacI family DNA-binding transcriptional regulator [Actinomadura sp. WMMB 499]